MPNKFKPTLLYVGSYRAFRSFVNCDVTLTNIEIKHIYTAYQLRGLHWQAHNLIGYIFGHDAPSEYSPEGADIREGIKHVFSGYDS